MLLRTVRRWSPCIAHLALLLVLNLLLEGPAWAERARLRPRLVTLPESLLSQGQEPLEHTSEEALAQASGKPASAASAILAASAASEDVSVEAPAVPATPEVVPPPPSLPDMPAASMAPAPPETVAAPAFLPSPGQVPLFTGWNLISLARQPDNVDPASVLASISGSYQAAHAYDACSSDPWRTWDPADPAGSSLTAIDHRLGLWVRATAAATLAVSGTEPAETSIRLCRGWNLIGYPLSQPRPVLAALSSIAGRFQRVYGWDPADPDDPWEIFDVSVPAWANDLEQMLPGRGYWIYATADTTLVMSNAGLPPEVAISSPANAAAITAPTDIVGTVSSNLLETWTLTYRLKGETASTTFATGHTPVANQVLGRLDPTLLLNGLYEIELTATDFQGRSTSTSLDVTLEGSLKVGHFTLSFVDLEVPVAGVPIQVIRTYDSRDKNLGDFGTGWRLSLSKVRLQEDGPVGENWRGVRNPGLIPLYCIQATRAHLVTVTLPGDQIFRFRPKLNPECQQVAPPQLTTITYVPMAGTRASLAPLNQSEAMVVGSFPGNVELWDDRSITLSDPTQYRLTIPDGRSFVVDQTAGLVSLRDLNGNTLTVGRNGITHSSGSGISFQRDAQGRITRVTDPEGASLTYAYDASADLAAVTDRGNATTRFAYRNHYLLSIQDPLGRQPIRNEYDDSGRLVRSTDAFGKTIDLTHSLAANREVVTDRLGHSRVLEYDARGNVVRETDALGKETRRTFDADNRLLSETDPLGRTATFTYDADGNRTSITDPLGNRTSYTYNAGGNVLTTTDPRGKVTTNTYSAAGNLLSTTDPLGNTTSRTYDARGNLLTRTDAEGKTTAYTYDAAGNQVSETDAAGTRVTSTYDRNGNRRTRTTTRTTPNGVETLTWTYEYDSENRLRNVLLPDGSGAGVTFDPMGHAVETRDALGRRTAYRYDEMGRLLETAYPDGTKETNGYDAEGRRTSVTDRAGRTTRYAYDAVGRPTVTTFPDGARSARTYDAAGQLASTTDERNHTTAYEYDAAGRQTKVRDPLGNETVFAYDAAGNRTAIRDARGDTTTFEYDGANRLTKVIYPDGTSRTATYDRVGRRTSETDEEGRITRFELDALGRLIAVTDPLGQVTLYGYDANGDRISQTDAKGHTTRFEHDAQGRVTKRILPGGATESYTYDAVGNRLTRRGFDGTVTTYVYDPADRALSRTYPDGTGASFTYTATGMRASATDARGTTTYAYDDRDRLTAITDPEGRTLRFAYDAAGNRTAATAEIAGQTLTTNYAYDEANRLQSVMDPADGSYAQGYDQNGNRTSLVHPNGVASTFTYDSKNRLTSLSTATGVGEIVQSYVYDLSPAGNRDVILEQDGTQRDYGYDALDRLVAETVTRGGSPVYRNTFAYDAAGNRQRQTRQQQSGPEKAIDYGYDDRDRLLTEGSVAYGWDPNGNLISRSGPEGATFTWDAESRLVRVELAAGTSVEHSYDADGNRIRTKVVPPSGPPAVTDYLVDPAQRTGVAQGPGLSQVVAETDGATGDLLAYHVRGNDLLATLRPASGGGWDSRYLHGDGLGSVRVLTDETGGVTDRYAYEAFGQPIDHQGSDSNSYRFAGELTDPASGLHALRARWMSSALGLFLSPDPLQGTARPPFPDPLYAYAGANPVVRVDPSGLAWVWALLGTYIHQDIRRKYPGPMLFGMIPSFAERLFPDIADLATKEVIEIKPLSEYGLEGYVQLWGYINALNTVGKTLPWIGVGWHPGLWTPGPGPYVEPILKASYIVVGNIAGVLFYYRAPVPVTEPVWERVKVRSKELGLDFQRGVQGLVNNLDAALDAIVIGDYVKQMSKVVFALAIASLMVITMMITLQGSMRFAF
jgi:RHS repeat-associated protein